MVFELRHQSDYLNPQDESAIGEEGIDQFGYEEGLQRSNFDLTDFRVGSQHQAGLYAGPTLHYAEKNCWITGGALWQIKGHGNAPGDSNTNDRNWDEHEKLHLGLFVGFEF